MVVDSVGMNVRFPAAAVGSGALCSKLLRRKIAGKSSLAPEKFGSSAKGSLSIIGRCAGGSASTGSGPPSAFFSINLLCPAAKCQASADHLRPPDSEPTERDQTAFARAPAWQKIQGEMIRRQAGVLSAGPACQWKRLVPKSRVDEIPGRECCCRIGLDRSRELERFRPDICAHAAHHCDSSRRRPGRATSGVNQKDRSAECEDRYAFAANS